MKPTPSLPLSIPTPAGLPPLLPPLRGLCPELPAKHRFNSADKSPSRNHHPQHLGRDRDGGGGPYYKTQVKRPQEDVQGLQPPGCQHSQGALCQPGQVPPSPPDKGGLFSLHEGGMDFGGSQLLPARPQDRRVKKPKDKPQAVLGCWATPPTLLWGPPCSSCPWGQGWHHDPGWQRGEGPPPRPQGFVGGRRGENGAFELLRTRAAPAGHRPLPHPLWAPREPRCCVGVKGETTTGGKVSWGDPGDGNGTPATTFHLFLPNPRPLW